MGSPLIGSATTLADLFFCIFSQSVNSIALIVYPDSEWKVVVARAVIIGGLLCYGTGLMGYLSFRSATNGDILDNFSGMLASFFKIMVVVHLIMYIPNEVG